MLVISLEPAGRVSSKLQRYIIETSFRADKILVTLTFYQCQ